MEQRGKANMTRSGKGKMDRSGMGQADNMGTDTGPGQGHNTDKDTSKRTPTQRRHLHPPQTASPSRNRHDNHHDNHHDSPHDNRRSPHENRRPQRPCSERAEPMLKEESDLLSLLTSCLLYYIPFSSSSLPSSSGLAHRRSISLFSLSRKDTASRSGTHPGLRAIVSHL